MIRTMIEGNFDADVERVMFVDEACERLRGVAFDLVIVNRLIFEDQSDGLELIRRMKSDGQAGARTPVMLISNRAAAQRQAVELGAASGFGKARIGKRDALELLGRYLPQKTAQPAR